jgi:hypothetical protein
VHPSIIAIVWVLEEDISLKVYCDLVGSRSFFLIFIYFSRNAIHL